jgi:PAT family beta-lactamase induction signal transducer AmpG
MAEPKRAGTWSNLVRALSSWRTASISMLAFASGMPLGMVWIAIPDWLKSQGVDIKTVGLITLAQAPWTFKFLWAPLMDRWAPRWLGRRRGWIALAQLALIATTASLALAGGGPDVAWVVGALALALAFAAATQDIAYDAYAVDVLRPEEQGPAVGARTAIYRAAMFVAGGLTITLAAQWSWAAVCLVQAALYLPLLLVTLRAPEPEVAPVPPRTLGEAVWEPLLGFLGRPRALEILAFVLLYKFADQLGGALLRPFLVDLGYDATIRGVALATVSMFATLAGTFCGGLLTPVLGLGRALWIFGLLQIFSNLGYIVLADAGLAPGLLYAALGFEAATQGLGTGAFGVLLLRLTQKRFSATQFALFSSMFGIPRVLAGPISGLLVDAIGWKWFFWSTMAMGIPGLLLLARFVPWRERDPQFAVEEPAAGAVAVAVPVPAPGWAAMPSRARLIGRGALVAVVGILVAGGLSALLAAVKAMRASPDRVFDLAPQIERLLAPATLVDWLEPLGIVVLGVFCGLASAALTVARARAQATPGATAPAK